MAVVLGKCGRELLPPAGNTAGLPLPGAQRKTTVNGVAPVGAIGSYLYHVQLTHSLAPQPSGHGGGWDRQDEGVHQRGWERGQIQTTLLCIPKDHHWREGR